MKVIASVEETLGEKKVFEHLVDSKRTAGAINDLLVKTVTNAARSLLATRPKDAEEWVIRSRAQSNGTVKAKER